MVEGGRVGIERSPVRGIADVSLRTRVITEEGDLDAIRTAWDGLAVASRRPLAAPAWQIAWWRAMAPEGARLRVVVVEDETGAVVGVAPYLVVMRSRLAHYLPLGGPDMCARNAPLAAAGAEVPVARAIAEALSRCSPRPAVVALDQVDVTSPWPALLRRSWPGLLPPRLEHVRRSQAPTLHLDFESYEEWLATKNRSFRGPLGRRRRRLAELGAVTRIVETQEELEWALGHFRRLHGARWGDATSLAGEAGFQLMLEAGRELLPSGRFRVCTITIDDEPVTVNVFIAAGGDVALWNGGWAAEYASLSPTIVGICFGIEDAIARGDVRMDFGEGDYDYKMRFTDHDEDIEWIRLYPRGPRYALTFVVTAPARLRPLARTVVARLPDGLGRRLRRLARRGDAAPGET